MIYNVTMCQLDPVEELLADYSPRAQAISHALRAMIAGALPEAHEFVHRAAVNYALVERAALSTRACCIAPKQRYVNLMFFVGAALPDPQHLLVGTGYHVRRVKVKTLEEASNPALERFVRAAWGIAWMAALR